MSWCVVGIGNIEFETKTAMQKTIKAINKNYSQDTEIYKTGGSNKNGFFLCFHVWGNNHTDWQSVAKNLFEIAQEQTTTKIKMDLMPYDADEGEQIQIPCEVD